MAATLPAEALTVSVIIPSYNGAAKLPNILAAIQQQLTAPHEVIVVVDGSTDNTAEVLQSYQTRMANLRVVMQENKGRAAVRNRGAAEATGQLLVFFDDDMRPQPECLTAHVAHHQQYPGSLAVGMQQEEMLPGNSDFQNYKASLSRKWLEKYVAIPDGVPMDPQGLFVSAANLSVPATVFQQISGFDSVLRDIEDFDLGMRASEQGFPIYFLRNAIAWHDDFVTCGRYVNRLREYRKAHAILAGHRGELYYKYLPGAAQKPQGIKAAVFRLLAAPGWVKLVDGNSLQVLPRAARYKLYDLVITAQGNNIA
ncbi:glycosyltransferase family 2 protein [Hymenobacter pini]|uniref:glycosyltransferase family 2 protein n=1 Tax=Hymenobacter pini TaxID=2880879 RepID=UPI001CF468CC|nr:glycosyltransferase family 2 protein [Hymenobacter pini]MCA8833416.1 glycosyltransferase [Hymenobacter pini]